MKVFHIMAGAAAGGAETAFAELCAAQKMAGCDVQAICRTSNRNTVLHDAGVTLTELPFGGLFDFKTKPALKKKITSDKPDVVVTWMNRAAKKMPRSALRGTGVKWIARLGGYYDLKYYGDVDHFVVNAPDIGKWMRGQGVPDSKITFIPNFAEIPAYSTPVARNTLDTPDDAFVFLTLARLHTNKAIDTLLRAFAGVDNAYLWIAGEGPERKNLEALAQELNITSRVRFLGWREDRWNLLGSCDAFVLASRHEPFGNSFMQAWAAGRALITTASQGPAHFVKDGQDALVTPIDDVNALKNAMIRVMQDAPLRQSLAQAGQKRYAQVFDKEAILAQWQSLFARLEKRA